MADFERFERSDRLEAAPRYERSSSSKHRIGAAVLALSLLSGAPHKQEAPTTDSPLAEAAPLLFDAISEIQELREAQQQTIHEIEVERLTRHAEAAQERQQDPYLNDDEIVILYEEPFVEEYGDYLVELADEFDINVNHLVATGMVESCLDASTDDSHVGAQGAFQVMPEFVADFRQNYGDGPYDPQNIMHSTRMGAAAYAMLLNGAADTTELSSKELLLVGGAAYNAGPGPAREFIAADFDTSVLPGETQGHLTELTHIFDERAQDREDTNRCAA